VLAFTGVPGAFPILEKDVPLQQYLKWSDLIDKKANEFINNLKETEQDIFLGIHLRIGEDFKKACEHARESESNFFGSAQCLGYRLEHGAMSPELCYPSEKTIVGQVCFLLNHI
jgi:peptide-O-fucosyltransferase